MHKTLAVFVVAVALAVSACGGSTSGGTSSVPRTFISFDQFLTQVQGATYADYSGLAGTKVRDAQAFAEMRAYILQYYQGVKVVSSFIYDSMYVDCVTVATQPSVLRLGITQLATAPEPVGIQAVTGGTSPGSTLPAGSIVTAGLTDPFGHPVACPAATIPVQRLTLERLVHFQTLHAFLAKSPDAETNLDPGNDQVTPGGPHRYAKGDQTTTNYGGDSWLSLWIPGGYFSLSQQWYSGGNGGAHQTIEGGWVDYPDSFGSNSVLFIYWTADNYASTGCYNLECAGFVQTNPHWYLGGPWTHYSSIGGEQWGFELQWKLYQGNWWLFLRGAGSIEAVGYLPTSVYNGGALTGPASWDKYGGETFDNNSGTWPHMGSSNYASTGWRNAAYQNDIFYIPRDENGGTGVWASLSPVQTCQRMYTVALTPASDGGSWGTYEFFGGPGGTLSC